MLKGLHRNKEFHMCLQNRILKEYRSIFPRFTLRETSAQTGIQLTRIFRLFNGSAMRLDEYERFHQVVYGDSAASGLNGSFRRVTESIARNMSPIDLRKIVEMLEQKLHWHQLINQGNTTETIQGADIA